MKDLHACQACSGFAIPNQDKTDFKNPFSSFQFQLPNRLILFFRLKRIIVSA